jgi:serine/threonine-protein kinase
VQLREPYPEVVTPVHLPGSAEMPAVPDPAGRLQLHGEIARGGMGAVLKGRDTDLGRDVAVKVLLETHAGKTELVQRFVEEAQIAGQLQHPGITPVYELGQFADRRPYFTMKLLKGHTLAKLLDERSTVGQVSGLPVSARAGGNANLPDLPRLLGIFAQVCQTLAYAHARGVIHRDLKPANVMVGSFGEVQVMDWGLAKVLQEGGVADEQRTQLHQEVSVIRTRRSGAAEEAPGSHTQAGSVLGTPAYMAPEQARGDVELVDERADVFGLGAILCEVLTGRPPFPGKTAEAHRKAQAAKLDDACARLDACGADAELVALAKCCLAAEPWDRPRNAGAVVAAVTAHQQSVAQRLRQAELERAAAEARAAEEKNTRQMAEARAAAERQRRRATLALAATVLLVVLAVGGAAAWGWQEHTAAVREVDAALAEVGAHRQAGRWPEARAALQRAEGRLGGGGPRALRERVEQARRDADMIAELDAIRMQLAEGREGKMFDTARADGRYAEAFRGYGIVVGEPGAAERLRGSAVRQALLAALDDWMLTMPADGPGRTALRALADEADDNAWRRSFRGAALRRDGPRLKALAQQEEALAQPPAVLAWLGDSLCGADLPQAAVALLRQAQQRYPSDFWVNYRLGLLLVLDQRVNRPQEAEGFFRAAIALRPGSAEAHSALSIALTPQGDYDGAVAACRQAIALDPQFATAHLNLGHALWQKGNLDAAIPVFRQALALDPNHAAFYLDLSRILARRGDLDGAREVCRQALTHEPKDAEFCNMLAWYLAVRFEDPRLRDPQQAVAMALRAVQLEPQEGNFWNTLGAARYRARQWNESVEALEKSMALRQGGDPYDWFFLAMAHRQLGQKDEARRWYRQTEAWREKHRQGGYELHLLQAEAAELLGLPVPEASREPKGR